MITRKQLDAIAKAVNRVEISSAVACGVSAALPANRRHELRGTRVSIIVDAGSGEVLNLELLSIGTVEPDNAVRIEVPYREIKAEAEEKTTEEIVDEKPKRKKRAPQKVEVIE